MNAHEIGALLSRYKLRTKPEQFLQADIEFVLREHGVEFEREKRLSPGDRPDFYLPGGIVIECKSRTKDKMAIFRQLARYAELDSVSAVILVTNTAMGLPQEANGKPLYYLSVGKAWL